MPKIYDSVHGEVWAVPFFKLGFSEPTSPSFFKRPGAMFIYQYKTSLNLRESRWAEDVVIRAVDRDMPEIKKDFNLHNFYHV